MHCECLSWCTQILRCSLHHYYLHDCCCVGDHELRLYEGQQHSLHTIDQGLIKRKCYTSWLLLRDENNWTRSSERGMRTRRQSWSLAVCCINTAHQQACTEIQHLLRKRNATVLLMWAHEVKPAHSNYPSLPELRAKFGSLIQDI